eukprot:TRINITY_DN159_c0_g1_i1.p1 TRINITY_DN159_c0_g1~~TRINITY_DN159_c0_g1_i1.p1  ORF type:complete len:714 (-),score=220.77 TRINITY_DN159_c0_g1_i1:284-2425(-)
MAAPSAGSIQVSEDEVRFHTEKAKIAKEMLEKLHRHPNAGDYDDDEDGLVPPSAPLPDSHFKRRLVANEALAATELYLIHDEVKDPRKKSSRSISMEGPVGDVALVDEIHPAVAKALQDTVGSMSDTQKAEMVAKKQSFVKAATSRPEGHLSRLLSRPTSKTYPAPAKKTTLKASEAQQVYNEEQALYEEDPTLRSLKQSVAQASVAHDEFQKILKTGKDPSLAKKSPAHEKPVLKDPMGLKCVAHLEKKWTTLARAVRETIYDPDFYDDGTYGPMYVRLAIHGAATWDKDERSGGLEGACMRYRPEFSDAHNKFAKHVLKRQHDLIKVPFPWASYADIECLCSYVALECCGGPVMEFVPGRRDCIPDGKDFVFLNYHERGDMGDEDEPVYSGNRNCPFMRKLAVMPGALPHPEDGHLGPPRAYVPPEKERKELKEVASMVRRMFCERMGATEQQTVALIAGGHSLGRCHNEISGYAGPWQPNPGVFNSLYCKHLVNDDWKLVDNNMEDCSGDLITGVKPKGMRRQYVNKGGKGDLMMLVSDMALREDPGFGKWVKIYADDNERLKKDFGAAFKAATEWGFTPPAPRGKLGAASFKLQLGFNKFMKVIGNSCSEICAGLDRKVQPPDAGSSAPKVGKPCKMEEVAKHNTKDDCWVVINGRVCDLTKFKDTAHPGGAGVIVAKAGQDASSDWNAIHAPDAIEKMAPETVIGHLV